jgi:hypothetical protein
VNPVLLITLSLAAIAVIAFAVYKAGFRPTKVKVKTGLLEAEMERSPRAESTSPPQFSQEATDGGMIRKANIKAPAGSPASATQKAEGKGSRLEETRIELE